jgi:hypothetical protein
MPKTTYCSNPAPSDLIRRRLVYARTQQWCGCAAVLRVASGCPGAGSWRALRQLRPKNGCPPKRGWRGNDLSEGRGGRVSESDRDLIMRPPPSNPAAGIVNDHAGPRVWRMDSLGLADLCCHRAGKPALLMVAALTCIRGQSPGLRSNTSSTPTRVASCVREIMWRSGVPAQIISDRDPSRPKSSRLAIRSWFTSRPSRARQARLRAAGVPCARPRRLANGAARTRRYGWGKRLLGSLGA